MNLSTPQTHFIIKKKRKNMRPSAHFPNKKKKAVCLVKYELWLVCKWYKCFHVISTKLNIPIWPYYSPLTLFSIYLQKFIEVFHVTFFQFFGGNLRLLEVDILIVKCLQGHKRQKSRQKSLNRWQWKKGRDASPQQYFLGSNCYFLMTLDKVLASSYVIPERAEKYANTVGDFCQQKAEDNFQK